MESNNIDIAMLFNTYVNIQKMQTIVEVHVCKTIDKVQVGKSGSDSKTHLCLYCSTLK